MGALRTKSALSYFGSDSEVAPRLASLLDHCRHVTIPFCGGMSILPHLKARAIVGNDAHHQVINFYRFVSGQFGQAAQRELIEKCQATLSHPEELTQAKLYCEEAFRDSLNQAWAFWALCWVGRKGKGGTKYQGGMPSVRRTACGGTNASRIRAAANDLELWAKQLERCEWESVDFRVLLPKVADRHGCGIYCDPPWVGVGRNYLHNFSDEDHSELELLLRRFSAATVVVRYGDCEPVRGLYSTSKGWQIVEAESRDQCNAVKGEVWLIRNPGGEP